MGEKEKMSIIALLTDFGLKDNFVGVMKGVIYKINPETKIVDLCHNIKPQDIKEAMFILKNSYRYFPEGTIFTVVVDPQVGSERKALIIKTKEYFFVAPDNGVLSFLQKDEIEKIIQITQEKYFLKPVSNTFHGRDIFGPVSAYISKGEKLENFGHEIKEITSIKFPEPIIKKNCLIGEVIYIDRFGNLITNIDEKIFNNFVKNHKFEIQVKNHRIKKLSLSYTESKNKKPIALFNSFNSLEISIYQTNTSKHLNIKEGAEIKICIVNP